MADRIKYAKERLKERFYRRLGEDGDFATPISGVTLHRRSGVTKPEQCIREPSIVKIVQGKKRSVVGGDDFIYGEDDVFIACVATPDTSTVIEASPELPSMGISVELDKNLIAQLSMEMPDTQPQVGDKGFGFILQPVDSDMLDAFLRLEAVLDKPEQVGVIGPMLVREIHFRALLGRNGHKLRSFYTYGSQKNQIIKAIAWLKENYEKHVTVEQLASNVHMAAPTFYRHFKETTAISPLQFQKRLRLHEAQRLMIMENIDVPTACSVVGYESLTQFTREYKRLFGEPPRRNVTRWQADNAVGLAVMSAD